MTKSQIDRLGDRSKRGNVAVSDLLLLEAYRASFAQVHKKVVQDIRDQLGLAPTGRQVKTTASVIAKLQREGTRLSRMQDIAGCRVVVEDWPLKIERFRNSHASLPMSR